MKALTLQPRELSEYLEVEPPVAVGLIDIEDGLGEMTLPRSRAGEPYKRLLALLRERGAPIGWVALPVDREGQVSLRELGEAFNPAEPASEPEAVAADASKLTIVVATCANPERALGCVEAIRGAVDGSFEVIVVENRPGRSEVRHRLGRRFGDDQRIRYIEEPRPGLARARNAGLRAAKGALVAFTDDDVRVDPSWAPALRAAFARTPKVDCVTGLILPLELETSAQLLDERFASFGKGFARRVYSLQAPPPDQPLFPYTAGYFGSGANMAFRTAALRALGGFDRALGTGTWARGGEDLDICIRMLHAGGSLAYEPAAIVWHRHPETESRVRRQAFDYGVGLGAMVGKQLVAGPNRRGVLALSVRGLRYYTNPDSRKNALRGSSFPRTLILLERLGLCCGPLAYLSSRFKESA